MRIDKLMKQATEKLDATLWDLFSNDKLEDSDSVSVLVRCNEASLDHVVGRVVAVGGRIQRNIPRFRLLVAWVPANQLMILASDPEVQEISHEEEYAVA